MATSLERDDIIAGLRDLVAELSAAGVVSQNTAGFSGGTSTPLYHCATNSVAITLIEDKRTGGACGGSDGEN